MRLDPKVKNELEKLLGKRIPPPDSADFDQMLHELRASKPDLAARLESSILFDDLLGPDEVSRQAVGRRQQLANLKHRLFDRYDELSGEWVPSRVKQIAVASVLLMTVMGGWMFLSAATMPAPVAAEAAQQAPGQAPAEPVPAPQQPTPTDPAQAPTETAAMLVAPEAAGVIPGPLPGFQAPPTPPPMGTLPPPPPVNGGTPGEAAAPAFPSLTLHTPGRADPAQAAAPPQPLSLAVVTAPAAPAPAQPMGITAAPATSPPAQPLTIVATTQAPATPEARPAGPQTPGQTGGEQRQGGALTIQTAPQAAFTVQQPANQQGQQSFFLMGGPAPQATAPVASPAAAQVFPPGPAQAAPAALPFPGTGTAAAPPAMPFPGMPGPSAATILPAPAPYPVGTRLRGRLGVTALVAQGASGPIVIDAEDGSVWVGQVTLDAARRLQGTLSRVLRAGREYTVSATLLDRNGTVGLPAEVREEAPSLAADLIRGSLRGVSEYVTAASQARQVTVLPGGGAVQTAQTPPLEMFMAGALANLFALRQGDQAVVRIAQANQGTEVSILVTPNEAPTTSPARP